ncbi:MAG: ribosome recycling factor [Clostridia bacterium]|nr:ribosome recycling factor [Clostridia bacterium]
MKLDCKSYEEKMKKTISSYENELSLIRAGRANPLLLAPVTFEYYGAPTPINTMADIKVTDAKTVMVSPYDASTLKAIEKAILASDIGITPNNDGKCLRLIFPQPTEERRKELAKQVQKLGEDSKVALRNVRRDANDFCKAQKKASLMTEDEQKTSEKSIQDLTDKYTKLLDGITSAKIKEIMDI